MGANKEENINEIKTSLENLLNVKTSIKPKRRSKNDKNREMFENIITDLEILETRTSFADEHVNIDLSKYNGLFLNIIDDLFELQFGKPVLELINFYLYNRFKNGAVSQLLDDKGNIIPLQTPTDLWNIIQAIKQ